MEIAEFKQEKDLLEKQISNLLIEFSRKTGIEISGVTVVGRRTLRSEEREDKIYGVDFWHVLMVFSL